MSTTIYQHIHDLIQYGVQKQLITKWDVDVVRNKVLEVLQLDEYIHPNDETTVYDSAVPILEQILDWAAEHDRLEENTVTYRDLLDTKLMSCFVPLPSEVNRRFYTTYEEKSPKEATNDFYQFSKDVHYIRTDRIAKNEAWLSDTPYGELEITINLSKPEKDPKAIAAAKTMKQSTYPECLLCKENAGYAGRVNHPARQNHRIIPVELNNEQWYLQFSPYVYYHEHAIIFSGEHTPMKISQQTFKRLLQFTDQFPHYFLGSNADLPIVGGSILSHDHFQGGYHEFPMAKAEIEKVYEIDQFKGVTVGRVNWPMSVVRLQGTNQEELVQCAQFIFENWQQYSDETVGVLAFTNDTPHNTVTPIARRRGELFELDLVLRNNRTSEQHPDGIFHPHAEVHHIKKENIGLIEVMGLAVLPGRLKDEMQALATCLTQENMEEEVKNQEEIVKHLEWAKTLKEKHSFSSMEEAQRILQDELGTVFATILEHAGVFKRDEQGKQAFDTFMNGL
ncbi:UDP-glucose--hexose-1-phosphate uridylyltransferase [Bacillus sp. CGMCC 1.16541]|uniref:UDP-glucose--hexose-1-phosphate uridylyltransferase n=1 Tax=Bacillus sp. CGMCC 1.16541 TaxID=2185143 RepID=UPI000D735E3F|nr:UDP-glucose--hexose-1-phosphate uridylyltransferase [Bacillus sp. CGMCC 1.16541]